MAGQPCALWQPTGILRCIGSQRTGVCEWLRNQLS